MGASIVAKDTEVHKNSTGSDSSKRGEVPDLNAHDVTMHEANNDYTWGATKVTLGQSGRAQPLVAGSTGGDDSCMQSTTA